MTQKRVTLAVRSNSQNCFPERSTNPVIPDNGVQRQVDDGLELRAFQRHVLRLLLSAVVPSAAIYKLTELRIGERTRHIWPRWLHSAGYKINLSYLPSTVI